MSSLNQQNTDLSLKADTRSYNESTENLYEPISVAQKQEDTIDNKNIVRRALESVIKERAVLYSRAPAWHKFNTVGAYVKLRDGSNNISISPLVCKGLTADFDGDTINVHVPATSGAQSDLRKKLFPDKQIFSGRDNRNIVNPITQEFLLGLWNANRKKGNKYQFKTKEEALAAIKRGAIRLNDDVEITG
jgi:DNA-directed RNA polymerase beta' subunit